MPSSPSSAQVRQRLLEAASEVFSENGYDHATFREICRRAKANLAAVNYHFRDKEQFYLAVIEHNIADAPDFSQCVDPALPAEENLRALILCLLSRTLGSERPDRFLRLFANEMINPTAGLDLLIEKCLPRVHNVFRAVAAKILGTTPGSHLADDCTRSIVSQCLIFSNSRAAILRSSRYTTYDDATIRHLADHIWRFSIGGLRAMAVAARPGGRGQRARPGHPKRGGKQ